MYAATSIAYTCISKAHGGCGEPHSRPVENGAPAKIWALNCPDGCENFLREDPMWSSTLSELPETYDEKLSREDFQRRGAIDRDQVMALAMAKLAGVELPDTMRRPISGLAPHVPVITGEIVCADGHPNEAGSKFCGECGSVLHAPVRLTCPDGHEITAKMRFCGECGQPVNGTLALETGEPPAATTPVKRRLKDMRSEQLKAMARERGLDDSGTRADVLERLRAA
jgi:hypothetical protein